MRLKLNSSSAQVYLVTTFATALSAAILFLLGAPLNDQVRIIVNRINLSQSFASAESGLEIGLYQAFKNSSFNLALPAEIKVDVQRSLSRIEATGRFGGAERTLFIDQE